MNIPKLRFKDNNGNDYPQWEKKLIKDILKIYHGKDYKNEPNEKKLYPVLVWECSTKRLNEIKQRIF